MTWIRRFPAAFFWLATMAATYVLGLAAYLIVRRVETWLGAGDNPWLNNLLLRFGPALAGIMMAAITAGRPGLRDLLRRCTRWQVSPLLYAGAIVVQPALILIVLLLRGYGPEVLSVGPGVMIGVFAGQLLLAVLAGPGFGEEIGWRGFMLPELCRRYSPLVASLWLGAAWLAWHIPAYLLSDKEASDPFLPFAVIIFPFSIVFTWAYFRSNQSVLLVAVLHGAIDAAWYTLEALLPDLIIAPGFQPFFDWTLTVFWWGLAGGILLATRFQLGRQAPAAAPAASPTVSTETSR
jgi:membrane protease YdiL (CAAX protease family)